MLPAAKSSKIQSFTRPSAPLLRRGKGIKACVSRVLVWLVIVGCFQALETVKAATLIWTGGAGDGLISTAGNWSTALAPVAGDTLSFAGSTGLAPNLSSSLAVAGITFNTGASAFTLGGVGTYTTNTGGIINSSTSTQTINNAITLGAAQTWSATSGALVFNGNINNNGKLLTVAGAFGTTINGIISGTAGLTKSSTSTGTLTINGANTYSGVTTLSGATGTVAIGNNLAFGTGTLTLGGAKIQTAGGARTISNVLSLTTNTTFTNADDLTFTGNLALSANRTLTFSGAGTVTFGTGIISGTRSVTKAGTGTLSLNGSNTFSGGLIVNAGAVVLGGNTAAGTGTLSLGTATVQAGGAARTLTNAVTLKGNTTFSGAYGLTFTGATAVAATRTLSVSNTTTFSGLISGAGGLSKNGAGTLTLSGTAANTFSGSVAVNDGTLVLNKTAALNAFAGTVLTIGDSAGAANSAMLQLSAANQIPNTTAVTINPDGQMNLQGLIDAIGALTMTGGSVTGTSPSRLDLGGNLTVTPTSSNVAQISANVGLNAARTFTINDNAVSTDKDLTLSGIISTAFALTKTGAGTLSLEGANTFSAGAIINAGTLVMENAAALGTAAANLGDTSGTSTASLLFGNTSGLTVTNAITVRSGSSGALTLGGMNTTGTNTFSGAVTLNKAATVTAAAGGEVAFSNVISGAGFGITKTGNGTLRLSGTNTYTGLTTINAGTLAYGASNVIATGGVTIDGTTAVLDLGANRTDTVGQVILDNGGSITGSGSATLSSTAAYDLRNGSVSVILNGSVALSKSTSATVTLAAANTYTGSTSVILGTLLTNAANSIPSTSAVSVSSGAALDIGSYNQTVGSIAGAGSVILGSGTLASGGDNSSTTFSGSISGNGGVTKNGTGTLTLSGTSTYTGATTVAAGILRPGASGGVGSTSAVTVSSGATLDLNSSSATVGSVAGAGSVILGSGTLTTGGNHSSTTHSGVISGTGGVTKNGTGTMSLTGTNTFSGSVLINAGTLTLSGASGRVASASGITIGNSTVLTLDNSAAEQADRIGNSAAITFGGGTLNYISDSNGSTETVGALNASGGASTVSVVHNGTAGNSTSLTFSSLGTIAPGATVNFSATGGTLGATSTGPHVYITGQAQGLIGGWATVGSDFAEYYLDGVRAFSSYYTGSLGINIHDASKIVLLNSSSLSSAYTMTNAGTTTDLGLSLADLATVDLGASSTRTLNLAGGGLIKSTATATTISGSGRLTAGDTTSGTLSVTVDAGNTLTISASIIDNAGTNGIYGDAGDGVVALTKADAGMLVLSGTNTFNGDVFINGGTLQIGNESSLGAVAKNLVFGGGTLRISTGFTAATQKIFTVGSDLIGTFDIATGETFLLGNASNVLTTGNAAGILYKSGSGILVVQGANTGFLGTARITAGTIEIRDAQSLGTGATRGRITLDGGTLHLRNDSSTSFSNNVTVITSSTIDVARLTGSSPAVTHTLGTLSIGTQTLTISGSNGAALTTGAATLTGGAIFNPTTADAMLGAISGAFGFTKTGAGTLVLNGTGSYTGATVINAGTLRLGVATGVTSSSAVTVATGAVFDLNNLSPTIGSLAGAGSVTLGSGTLTAGGDNTTTTFSGVISGSGGLTKNGSGTFTLSGANTYNGATTINAGTLKLGVATGIPSSSALSVSVASGATFNLNNFDATIGSLAGAGGVTLGSGTLSAGGDNSSSTFSGIISGSGGFTKNGIGIFTLSGTNTFSGTANINGGVIVVQNSAALGGTAGGSVVASGAELRIGSGTSIGAEPMTLSGSGASSAGALRVISGTASWSGGVTLASSATIGADAGQLTLGGTINLGANTLTFTGAGTTQSDGIISGSGALVKSGTGTLRLTAANTFTGSTTITAGAVLAQDDAVFGAAGMGGVSVIAGAAIQLNNVDGINVGDKLLTLNGGGISGVGAIDSIVGNHSWAGNVVLASDTTIAVEADSLELSGSISESGGVRALTKIGTGTLVFGGNNSYTGATAVNAGTLKIASSNRIGDSSAVTVASGAMLDLNDADETIGSLAGAGTVDFGTLVTASLTTGGDGTSTTFSGVLSGTGDLTKTGSGTLTLSGANTFTGTVFINAGVLSINADTRLGDSANALDFGGGTLRLTTAMTQSRTITLSTDGAIDTAGVNSTISSAMSGDGFFVKVGAGTLSLTAANTYTGDTTVSGGTLNIGASSSIMSSNVSVITGTVLSVASGGTVATSTALTADGTVNFNSAAVTIGSLSGASTGLVTLNSTNLSVGSGTYDGVIQNGGSSGKITKTGAGTLTLNGTNTYTGGTIINGGVLALGSSGAIGTTGTIAFGGGTLRYSAGNTTDHSARFSTAASQAYSIDTGGQSVTLATPLTSSGGSLNKSGAGTLNLTAVNTYAGTTTVSAGTLSVGSSGAIASTNFSVITGAVLTVASGGTVATTTALTADGTVNFNSASVILGSLSGASTGVVSLNTTTLSVGSGTFAGVVQNGAGAGSLTKTGVGTLTLNGANTYTGATTVSAGTLSVGSSGAIASTNFSVITGAVLTVASGGSLSATTALTADGTVNFNSPSVVLSSLSGASTGIVALNSTALSVGSGSFAGVIQNGAGAGSVIKTGAGTLTLSGVSTYTGATTISAGKLALTGTGTIAASSQIVIASGATFDVSGRTGGAYTFGGNILGSGTILGDLTTSGTIAPGLPGAETGTLTTGKLTFTPVATTNLQIGGKTAGLFDRIVSSGQLTLDGTINVTFTNGITAGNLALNDSFDLLDWASLISTGFNLSTDLALPDISAAGLAWNRSSFLTTGNVTVVIPEPSRFFLILLAFLSLILRRRRRSIFSDSRQLVVTLQTSRPSDRDSMP